MWKIAGVVTICLSCSFGSYSWLLHHAPVPVEQQESPASILEQTKVVDAEKGKALQLLEQQKIGEYKTEEEWGKEKSTIEQEEDINKIKEKEQEIQTWIKADPLDQTARKWIQERKGHVAVAFYDEKTEQMYVVNPNQVFCLASVAKVGILAKVMQGQTSLTSSKKKEMEQMIENSDNDAASYFWNTIGKENMQQFFLNMGMAHTQVDEQGRWGLTKSTVVDQILLLKAITTPGTTFTPAAQADMLSLMENVEQEQRWGLSAGVAPGSKIAIKNGWSPDEKGLWRINSLARVQKGDRTYLAAVFTDTNPSMAYGIATIEQISNFIQKKG